MKFTFYVNLGKQIHCKTMTTALTLQNNLETTNQTLIVVVAVYDASIVVK